MRAAIIARALLARTEQERETHYTACSRIFLSTEVRRCAHSTSGKLMLRRIPPSGFCRFVFLRAYTYTSSLSLPYIPEKKKKKKKIKELVSRARERSLERESVVEFGVWVVEYIIGEAHIYTRRLCADIYKYM